jgi:hypothetical protein
MTTELEVLGLVSDRLSAHGLPFMLTGSFALAYYATPRMTRDLDIVVALDEKDVFLALEIFYRSRDAIARQIGGTGSVGHAAQRQIQRRSRRFYQTRS